MTELKITWVSKNRASRFGRFEVGGNLYEISLKRDYYKRADGQKGYVWNWSIGNRDQKNKYQELQTGFAFSSPVLSAMNDVQKFLTEIVG